MSTVLVYVKQVPDTQNITGAAMTPEGTVNRAALPTIFNPDDLHALETALQLKDKYGVKVVVATMGPPTAAEVLRRSLYLGADEAILLTDRAFAGADTLATSYALSCVAAKVPEIVLAICGRQAIDGDTAQVGPQIAEKLSWPQLCYVEEVEELTSQSITVRRAIDGGSEILQSPLPALLTVIDANEPRPESALRIMKYKRARTASEVAKKFGADEYTAVKSVDERVAELQAQGLLIQEWTAATTGADLSRIGLAGSPTKVKAIQSVVLTATEVEQVPPTEPGISALMKKLISDHTLG